MRFPITSCWIDEAMNVVYEDEYREKPMRGLSPVPPWAIQAAQGQTQTASKDNVLGNAIFNTPGLPHDQMLLLLED